MIDENINSKPYKVGDKLIIEVTVTDEDKSFNYLGKALMNKMDTSNIGLQFDLVSFWKDRYINHIPEDLLQDIRNELEATFTNINNKLLKR